MCTKFKSCHFSITDIIDVDENVEVMLFCSFHDCLPEDVPNECDVEEVMHEQDMKAHEQDMKMYTPEPVYDDVVPF